MCRGPHIFTKTLCVLACIVRQNCVCVWMWSIYFSVGTCLDAPEGLWVCVCVCKQRCTRQCQCVRCCFCVCLGSISQCNLPVHGSKHLAGYYLWTQWGSPQQISLIKVFVGGVRLRVRHTKLMEVNLLWPLLHSIWFDTEKNNLKDTAEGMWFSVAAEQISRYY